MEQHDYQLTQGSVPVIQAISLLSYSELRQGFSTRYGGVSEGVYASMNLGYHRGDSKEKVAENFRRIGTELDISPSQMVATVQKHHDIVRVVTATDCGKGIVTATDETDVDALVTAQKNVCLTVYTADCVPIFLYDPVMHVIAVAHAGWRGTALAIAAKTVQCMIQQFTCSPSTIVAVIGPSVCQTCYEVGQEVVDAISQVLTNGTQANVFTWKQGKAHCDLWEANRQILLQAGLTQENITKTKLCTCCRNDLFFSHRKTGDARGSNAGFLMMKG